MLHTNKQITIAICLLVIGGLSIMSLIGCAKPVSGIVVEKDYDPATRKKSADWDITVRSADGVDHEIEVSRKTYNQYNVGDKYP